MDVLFPFSVLGITFYQLYMRGFLFLYTSTSRPVLLHFFRTYAELIDTR
jgi:hypothetical protein